MDFFLTNHAKKRMVDRKIKLEDIKDAINFPNYTITRGNKVESYKKIKNNLLNVIYIKKGKFIKIITLVWK